VPPLPHVVRTAVRRTLSIADGTSCSEADRARPSASHPPEVSWSPAAVGQSRVRDPDDQIRPARLALVARARPPALECGAAPRTSGRLDRSLVGQQIPLIL